MGDDRKSAQSASVEKIYDRLTLLVIHQDLLQAGTYGPLNAEQKAILNEMVARSKEIAKLLREVLDH